MVDMNDVSRRMNSSVVSLSNDFSGLRAGRASTTMLDPVIVDAYGSKMPLNQLSNVSAPESRLLTVTVWDETPLRVIVATKFVAVSSDVVTCATERDGVPSSSVIVTVPVASDIVVFVGLLRPILNVSSSSSKVS